MIFRIKWSNQTFKATLSMRKKSFFARKFVRFGCINWRHISFIAVWKCTERQIAYKVHIICVCEKRFFVGDIWKRAFTLKRIIESFWNMQSEIFADFQQTPIYTHSLWMDPLQFGENVQNDYSTLFPHSKINFDSLKCFLCIFIKSILFEYYNFFILNDFAYDFMLKNIYTPQNSDQFLTLRKMRLLNIYEEMHQARFNKIAHRIYILWGHLKMKVWGFYGSSGDMEK